MKKVVNGFMMVSVMFMSYCADTGAVSDGGTGCLDPNAHAFYNEVIGMAGSEQAVKDAITFFNTHECPTVGDYTTQVSFYNSWNAIIGTHTTAEVDKMLNTTVQETVSYWYGGAKQFSSSDTNIGTVTTSTIRNSGIFLSTSTGAVVSGATNLQIVVRRISSTNVSINLSPYSFVSGMYTYTLFKDTGSLCGTGDTLIITGSYDYNGITYKLAQTVIKVLN